MTNKDNGWLVGFGVGMVLMLLIICVVGSIMITINEVKEKERCTYYCDEYIGLEGMTDCNSFHIDGYMGAVCKYDDDWVTVKDGWRTALS